MLVLITYDVNTEDAAGRKRLRQIAKKCVDYGQRVQNSVFECLLDAGQCRSLQAKLLSIMDPEKDSLRFYYLGNQYEKKVEHFGCKNTYRPALFTLQWAFLAAFSKAFVTLAKDGQGKLCIFAVAPPTGSVD